jgi:brefeldin A-resistance guanine nucleotide exchange factor 1
MLGYSVIIAGLIAQLKHLVQHEAIPESLKNVVLVMQAADILVPPTQEPDQRSERQQALWAASQERIERFLPGFLDAVIAAPQYAATTTSAPNVEESH